MVFQTLVFAGIVFECPALPNHRGGAGLFFPLKRPKPSEAEARAGFEAIEMRDGFGAEADSGGWTRGVCQVLRLPDLPFFRSCQRLAVPLRVHPRKRSPE